MDVMDRIKQRRKQLGLSAEELADQIGVCPATVYRYESNQIKHMRVEKLKPIADALHTTPEWLMGWSDSADGIPAGLEPLPAAKRVPLLGSAGSGAPSEGRILGYVDAPDRVACDCSLVCREDFAAGEHIRPGDLVYLRRCDRPAPGSIAALAWQGTVSLYRFCESEDWIVLMTSDWTTPPVVLSPGEMEHVQVLGQVVGYLHSL